MASRGILSSEDCHTVPSLSKHSHTIIFLHGRDSVATEFAEELFESQAADDRTLPEILPMIKWIFPTSKIRKSARFDTDMSQWFDMHSVEDPSENEELQREGLLESVTTILQIIREEALSIPLENIILAGISQGCATALFSLLCGGVRLGGFIGLSSWIPFQRDMEMIAQRAKSEAGDVSRRVKAILESEGSTTVMDLTDLTESKTRALGTPIFVSHSRDDEVVPIENGETLRDCLQSLGFVVSWKAYEDGGHWINEPQGVEDIAKFVDRLLR